MKTIYVGDICRTFENKAGYLSVDKTIDKLIRHITKHIDPTLPADEFRAWVDSDQEKPFTWNRIKYYWETK